MCQKVLASSNANSKFGFESGLITQECLHSLFPAVYWMTAFYFLKVDPNMTYVYQQESDQKTCRRRQWKRWGREHDDRLAEGRGGHAKAHLQFLYVK